MESRRFRICLIDGDGESVGATAAVLKRLPADVIPFVDGQAGLAALMSDPFDLLVLDLMLDGLSGFEVIERARKKGRNQRVPIMVVSPLLIDDTLVSEEELAVDASLPKPVDLRELERVARSLLRPGDVDSDESKRRKLLLVEDNEYNAELVRLRLGHEMYTVSHAADGASALELFRSFRPDVVLLDIQIPAPNGLEVLKAIRRDDPDALVVMMTAFGSEKVAVEAMKIGADEYLTKPLEHRKLEAFLEEAWVRNRLKSENRQLMARLWLSNKELLRQYKATSAAMRALREKQDELVRVQRLAAVTEAAVSINHEINNPLSAIMANAQSLRLLNINLDDKAKQKLQKIEEQVRRIASVTERLRQLEEIKTDDYISDGPMMIDIGTVKE